MNDILIASSEAESVAAEAVITHHAQLAGALGLKVEVLVAAASTQNGAGAASAKAELVAWCERELVPHALAEEQALYPAARAKPEARLLIEAMLDEHVVLTGLVQEIAGATDPVRAAAAAQALLVAFDSHLRKENDLVLPLLVGSPEVSVAGLLESMHELLGEHAHREATADASDTAAILASHEGSCGCGESDGPDYPELDARVVPHKIRHATVLGALESVRPSDGMILLAPHDPLPLLAQVGKRFDGAFAVEYLERGPEVWRLALVRNG